MAVKSCFFSKANNSASSFHSMRPPRSPQVARPDRKKLMALAKRVKHIADDGGKELLFQQGKQFCIVFPLHASSSVTAGGKSRSEEIDGAGQTCQAHRRRWR